MKLTKKARKLARAAQKATAAAVSPSAQEAVAWLDRFLPPLAEMRAIIVRLDARDLDMRSRMFVTEAFRLLTESLRSFPVTELDRALKKLREIETQMVDER